MPPGDLRAQARGLRDLRFRRAGQNQRYQCGATQQGQQVVTDVGGRRQHTDQQLRGQRSANIDNPVNAHRAPACLVGDLSLQPAFHDRKATGDAEPRHDAQAGPGQRADDHHMRQNADGADRGESGETARMANGAHHPGRGPASNEEAKEMRRAQQADVRRAEPQLQPRDRVQRSNPAGAELQQHH